VKTTAQIAGLVWFSLMLNVGGQDSPLSSLKDSRKESKTEQELRLRQLEESLSLAQTESDYFHQKWVELKLENEALGMEALTANEKAMQEKLVRLVGEVYRSEKNRLKLQETVEKLISAGQRLQQAGPLDKAQRRAEYEVAVRAVKTAMNGEQKLAIASSKSSGRVASLQNEGAGNQVVANFGRVQGAQVGMPYRILRNSKVIGRARLIEVREYLSAALIEDVIENEKVQVGDQLLLETVK
jgi:hypothetical protein